MTDLDKRPEPVVDAAKIAAAVSGLVAAAGAITTLVGWTTAEQVQSLLVLIGGLITALATLVAAAAPIVAAYKARAKVTPLADPRTNYGTALVEFVEDDPTPPRHAAPNDVPAPLGDV